MSYYPSEETAFISSKAFDEACQELLSRSTFLRLSGMSVEIRRDGDHQYLKIIRLLNTNLDAPAQFNCTKYLSAAQDHDSNLESSDIDKEDEDVAVYHSSPSQAVPSIEYHILYSTSYRVPVLYFFLHNLPPSMSQNIDTIYEHLVPKHLQPGLRNVGIMGGIGMTNHPVTDLPCYWVHPCNSAEAMRNILTGFKKDFSPIEYLMLWVGLVGSAVGLSLPKEMIAEREDVSRLKILETDH